MITFIKFLMQMSNSVSTLDTMSPKKLIIVFIVLFAIFPMSIFYISYYFKKEKIKEYQRIEEEVKVFHEDNIVKLKTTLNNAKNAKKIDFNDTGNLDDDYLLKALE